MEETEKMLYAVASEAGPEKIAKLITALKPHVERVKEMLDKAKARGVDLEKLRNGPGLEAYKDVFKLTKVSDDAYRLDLDFSTYQFIKTRDTDENSGQAVCEALARVREDFEKHLENLSIKALIAGLKSWSDRIELAAAVTQ